MSNTHFLAAIQKITAGGLPLDELLVASQGLEPDQARQLYQVWISFNKDHPLLFIALRRLGNHEEALRIAAEATVACREGLPSLLSESIAFAAYAEVLLATGHREKACEALRQGLPYVERRVATVAEKYQKAFRDTVPENQTFYALVRDCLGKPSE